MTDRNLSMMFSRDYDANALRRICEETSAANPSDIVTGFFMFGRFPYVEYSATIGHDQVSDNVFSGYWLAGTFHLFSSTELALGEYDEAADDEAFERDYPSEKGIAA
jgi:hypothetical protein